MGDVDAGILNRRLNWFATLDAVRDALAGRNVSQSDLELALRGHRRVIADSTNSARLLDLEEGVEE